MCARALLLPDSAPASVRKTALEVLAPHSSPEVEGLPRAAAARLMLTVMSTGAAAQASAARPLLMEIAAGAAEDPDPASVARELRAGILSEFRAVRGAALASLAAAPPILDDDGSDSAVALLFLARHDPDEANRAAAAHVWETYGLGDTDLSELVPPRLSWTI